MYAFALAELAVLTVTLCKTYVDHSKPPTFGFVLNANSEIKMTDCLG